MVYCDIGDANAVPNNAIVQIGNMGRTTQCRICAVYPAKMLLVPTSKIHTNWLWVYKQNNTSIRDIITRSTAHTVEEASSETAPLEFQQAAIQYLEEMVKNALQAVQDEQESTATIPPENPILHQNMDQRFAVP